MTVSLPLSFRTPSCTSPLLRPSGTPSSILCVGEYIEGDGSYSPPDGCTCTEATRSDGYTMPDMCAPSPGTGNRFCYVLPESTCTDTYTSSFNEYEYVYCLSNNLNSECACEETWTYSNHYSCGEPQHGCTNCDSSDTPWCVVSNPGCSTAEELGDGRFWSSCMHSGA